MQSNITLQDKIHLFIGVSLLHYEKIEPGRDTSQKYKHVQFLGGRDLNAYNTNSVMPNQL